MPYLLIALVPLDRHRHLFVALLPRQRPHLEGRYAVKLLSVSLNIRIPNPLGLNNLLEKGADSALLLIMRPFIYCVCLLFACTLTAQDKPLDMSKPVTVEDNPGTHEEVTRVAKSKGALSEGFRNAPPLYIPSADSPQTSIRNFQELTRGIEEVFEKGSYYGDVNWEQEEELIDLYDKLVFLLDTSELPKDDAYARDNIIASQISEILDRIYLPPLEKIPNADAVEADEMKYWRIPETEISLSVIEEGPRKGDWVFSADTVEKADKFYERAQLAPYRKDANVGEIGSGGGILDHYINYTGPLLPVNFTDHIPKWMRAKLFGDPLWKYFGSFLILAALLLIFIIVKILTRYRSDKEDSPNHIGLQIRRLVLPVVMAFLLPLTIHLITVDVRLRLIPLDVTDDILWGLFYITSFWICVCVGNLISAIIISSPEISPFGLDASLVRLCTRIIAYLIGFYIIFEGFKDLGLSLVPLLAGVSISGLAFALAARPTLGNFLGGALIFADKPFVIGERVVIGKYDGIIEEIGLRSTRIRTLDGHLLTVPNEEVSSSFIENIGKRPYIKRMLNVTLTYDTPPEKIKQAIEIVRGLLSVEEDGGKDDEELGRPPNTRINTEDFPPRVFFNDLNADSLNLLVIYWYHPPDYMEYLDYCTWFNIQLIERFNRAGIDFAFPTQTIDLKQHSDQAPDAQTGEIVDDLIAHPGLYRTAVKPEDDEQKDEQDKSAAEDTDKEETPDETIERLAGSRDDESKEEKELKEAVEKKAAEEGSKAP